MQRSRRNRPPEGSYAEQEDSDDVVLDDIVDDESDDEYGTESAESDDEFDEDAPAVEEDRCEIYCILLQYYFFLLHAAL